jgi:thiamine biosynthesis lipoprotein
MNLMSTAERPTRRDFLQGRAAAAFASALIGPESNVADTLSTGRDSSDSVSYATANVLTSIRRRAMACEFEAQLAAGRADESTQRVLEALDLVESLEAQMTIYRDDSEVLRINRNAAREPVPAEAGLFALFQLAQQLFRDTKGAFDITSGPLSVTWGFSRRQGRLPTSAEIAEALQCVGMDNVILDAASRTVRFRRAGVSLHLNCIGKGYALDRMAEMLDGSRVGDYLLHGGRSSILARGDSPDGGQRGWTIGVPHPLRPGERLAEIRLVDEALGTSGSGTQFFEHDGRRFGHLIDPRTGWPISDIHTATAIAATAAEADALSTAFYVMNLNEVEAYCAGRPDIGALLVSPAEVAGEVQIAAFGMDDERLRFTADRNPRNRQGNV